MESWMSTNCYKVFIMMETPPGAAVENEKVIETSAKTIRCNRMKDKVSRLIAQFQVYHFTHKHTLPLFGKELSSSKMMVKGNITKLLQHLCYIHYLLLVL